jgi:hypothetical protein
MVEKPEIDHAGFGPYENHPLAKTNAGAFRHLCRDPEVSPFATVQKVATRRNDSSRAFFVGLLGNACSLFCSKYAGDDVLTTNDKWAGID